MDPWWNVALRSVFAGKDVILAGSVAAAWTEHLPVLRAAGAGDVLVIATEGRGAGPAPDVTTVTVEPPVGQAMMDRIRFGNEALADPPAAVRDAVEAFDPDRRAVVVGTFLNTAAELAGRPFLAYRRPEWLALEDKTVVDAFWDRAGVARQPSVVVDLDDAEPAARSIDCGVGTVWSADAREGFHGGASLTFRVDDAGSAARARELLGPHCDRVRVMPFLTGVPMSIHGIVLPDGVAVLRPVEMVVLRHVAADRREQFFYAGCATFHDPDPAAREQMVDVARRVGRQLATEVGFRGTFTVDGIVTDGGFWPTELNPRFGAGINTIARAGGEIPILMLNEIVGAGVPLGRRAAEIEAELVAMGDAHRAGGTWRSGLTPTEEVDARPATFDDGEWRWATDGDRPAGEVSAKSGFVRCRFAPDATPVGPSTATRAARFWAFADRELGTSIGPLAAPV